MSNLTIPAMAGVCNARRVYPAPQKIDPQDPLICDSLDMGMDQWTVSKIKLVGCNTFFEEDVVTIDSKVTSKSSLLTFPEHPCSSVSAGLHPKNKDDSIEIIHNFAISLDISHHFRIDSGAYKLSRTIVIPAIGNLQVVELNIKEFFSGSQLQKIADVPNGCVVQ